MHCLLYVFCYKVTDRLGVVIKNRLIKSAFLQKRTNGKMP